MSSTYAEKVIPCWSNTLRGMSKTTTNRKQERGQPCLTPCVVLKTTSSAPRRNVDPRSITREIMRSSRSGVPSLSRASRIRSLGGLSKAWYTSKARMASVGPIFSKSCVDGSLSPLHGVHVSHVCPGLLKCVSRVYPKKKGCITR